MRCALDAHRRGQSTDRTTGDVKTTALQGTVSAEDLAEASGRGIFYPTLTPMRSTSPDFDIHVRLARLTDVAALIHHRVSMFRDMTELPLHLEPELARASEAFFHASVASGEYVAWLAVTNDAPERVVAGAGLWLRPMLPRPIPTGISQGREGLVANVYTEPDWRRHGVATLLIRHLLAYIREHRIERVRLHASDHGRRLYESLGFVASNEMKLVHPS